MISKEYAKLMVLNRVREIKNQGLATYDTNTSQIVRDALERMVIPKPIIGLNTKGCSYANNQEGCFICGYLKGHYAPEKMYQQFLQDAKQYVNSNELVLSSNGSFFDPKEIPRDVQKKMLEHLISLGVKQIKVETRPEYINRAALKKLINSVPAKNIIVGLGFDTYTDDIRDLCLNKGYTRKQYDNATKVLNEMNISFESRIIVKPPFLTESEAIDEALISVNHAFSSGSSVVSLEPIAVQDFTLQDFLTKNGFYRVPWLWSAVHIVKQTHQRGKIIIGGDAFIPLPKETSYNCNNCTYYVRKEIDRFNETQDIELLDNLDCDCIREWKKDLEKKEISLYDRIAFQMRECES
jgi:hypothetical protein